MSAIRMFGVLLTGVCVTLALNSREAWAAKKDDKKKKAAETGKALTRPMKNLSQDIVFDGSSVNGRYHSAGEAVTKVEQEKKINVLIGLRSNFRDRLMVEQERLKKGEPAGAQ